MPVTAQALSFFEETFDNRREAFIRAVLGSRVGVLPGIDFSCDAMFVKSNLEINVRNCNAWLPSGRLMDIASEKVVVPVPLLSEGEYYLCASFGDGTVEFECKGVPCERPLYQYSLQQISSLKEEGRFMPLLKLIVSDGNISLDRDYIVPHIQIGDDKAMMALSKELVERLEKCVTHPNMNEDSGERIISYYRVAAEYYDEKSDTIEYLHFTADIASCLRQFYISDDVPDTMEAAEPSVYDIRKWFMYLFALVDEAVKYLDSVVVEDKSIDVEEIKRQITEDVYGRIKTEADEYFASTRQQLEEELSEKLRSSLRSFIEDEFGAALHDKLHTEVSDELKESLYGSLYTALYNALFVPEKEEEEFTPII